MAYAWSAARTKAYSRIAALRIPFKYARATNKLPTKVRDSIFQNSVFQLSAVLEDYLYELTSGWFAKLQAANASNSLIPALTRAVAILRSQEEAFRRYFGDKDEAGLAGKIAAASTVLSLLQDTDTVPAIDFDDLLLKGKKFPSVRNLNTLFRRIGLPKVSQGISRRTKTDFELNLQAFMDIRNALAHESPPSITDVDVAHYLRQMKRWLNAIDREFYSHVEKVSGPAYW